MNCKKDDYAYPSPAPVALILISLIFLMMGVANLDYPDKLRIYLIMMPSAMGLYIGLLWFANDIIKKAQVKKEII